MKLGFRQNYWPRDDPSMVSFIIFDLFILKNGEMEKSNKTRVGWMKF